MPALRFVLIASSAALAACTARAVPRAAPRLPAPAITAGGPNTSGPWIVGPSYATQGLAITTRAVVVISGDPATRIDTISATLDATYAWMRAARRRVSGSLTGYRVAAGGGNSAVPAGLTLPRAFTAEEPQASRALAFQLPAESSACADPALSALQGLHEAWIPLPDTLRIGREWSDTVRTLSCRDRLPVRGVSIRQFRVQRADVENDRAVLVIDRHSKGQTTASGEQFGEPVALAGEQSGRMQYVLDVVSGRFLRGNGRSSLDLTFTSRRRTQRVQQSTELTVTWKP